MSEVELAQKASLYTGLSVHDADIKQGDIGYNFVNGRLHLTISPTATVGDVCILLMFAYKQMYTPSVWCRLMKWYRQWYELLLDTIVQICPFPDESKSLQTLLDLLNHTKCYVKIIITHTPTSFTWQGSIMERHMIDKDFLHKSTQGILCPTPEIASHDLRLYLSSFKATHLIVAS